MVDRSEGFWFHVHSLLHSFLLFPQKIPYDFLLFGYRAGEQHIHLIFHLIQLC